MNGHLAFLFAGALVLQSCPPTSDTGDPDPALPAEMPCDDEVGDPVRWVDLYEFQGQDVYYFAMGGADMFNPVRDMDCVYLCAPDGGFAAGGDHRCPTFWDEAIYVERVWTAPAQ